MKIRIIYPLVSLLMGASVSSAQDSTDGLWKAIDPAAPGFAARAPANAVQPDSFRKFSLNVESLKKVLQRTPLEGTFEEKQRPSDLEVAARPEISVPTPDGKYLRVRVSESEVMEPALAAKYPELKTYRGEVVTQPETSVQLSLTPEGFRAQVLATEGSFYVDPAGVAGEYKSYFRRDHRKRSDFQCLVTGAPDPDPQDAQRAPAERALRSGQALRTYRLAVATTGEYTRFHGGTVPSALSAIVATVHRVNGIYEKELAVRLVLIANNDRLIFTDPNSDGFSNNSAGRLIEESQAVIDRLIGDTNYDVGHTFSTGAGGLAGLGVVCVSGQKARGVTGRADPVGDPYDVDFVAHEIGHQFGGDHTFNGSQASCSGSNRNGPTAYEPGSGTTIQAYAGICGSDDIELNSSPYFHWASLEQMIRYTTTGSGNQPRAVPTGNNPPTVEAGPNRVIPQQTPFVLTAEGSDPDNDPLSYCWEQADLGPQSGLERDDDGRIPLFRSMEPSDSPQRTFPRLADLLNNSNSAAEKLPSRARTMKFRVTARDNRSGGGGVAGDGLVLTVDSSSGPFRITGPNTGGTHSGAIAVTWDVARTNAAPVQTNRVNILLSVDGGITFRDILASATPNDGSQMVILPNTPTSAARIKVEAVDNVFFDISDANFSITPSERAVLVAGVDEGADRGSLGDLLDAANFDVIYTTGGGSTETLADEFARERGLQVVKGVGRDEIRKKIEDGPTQQRVLVMVPRSEGQALRSALVPPPAALPAPAPRPEAVEKVVELFGGGLSKETKELPKIEIRKE